MKITLIKEGSGVDAILPNGEKLSLSIELSRILTKTYNQSDFGIFSESVNVVDFYRPDAIVSVQFEKPFPCQDELKQMKLHEVADLIISRVSQVETAFNEKAVSILYSDSFTFEI